VARDVTVQETLSESSILEAGIGDVSPLVSWYGTVFSWRVGEKNQGLDKL
jgi:hypothetical protein